MNNSYFLLYPKTAEQEIAIRERKKPIRRIMIVWLSTAYLWFIFGLAGYVAYYDDAVVYSKYGSPFYIIGKTRNIQMFFMMYILVPAIAKTVTIKLGEKDETFVFELNRMLLDGTNGGLNERNTQRIAWRIAFIVDVVCRIAPLVSGSLYGVMHIYLSVIAIIDQELDESVIPYIITAISYPLLSWYLARINVIGFTAFYLTQKFLQYRFEQVNSKFESSKSAQDLINAIEEHNLVCGYQVKNNVLMSIALGFAYYIMTPFIDFLIYQAIYMNSVWVVQATFIVAAIIFIAFLYILAFSSKTLNEAVHAPYKRLNAIMAKKEMKMSRMERIKIAFYIERFSGPEITTYCFDFFALNNYEFYLFIAAVCTNYFLIVGLIG
jgi:hypothetical protein